MEPNQEQLKNLKRRGHSLKPVVRAGAAGLSDGVIAEVERALYDHELIKVKLADTDRDEYRAMLERLLSATGATVVQSIGRVALLYRPNPDKR